MKRYVLDSCVALKWFLPEEQSEQARLVLEDFMRGSLTLVGPDLLLVEFAHVLGKATRARPPALERDEAAEIYRLFLELGIPLVRTNELAPRALQLGMTFHANVQDATFVALAQSRGLTVLTCDEKMANAYAALNCVELLKSH